MIVPAAEALITNGSLKRYSGVAAAGADDEVRDAKVGALRRRAPDGAQQSRLVSEDVLQGRPTTSLLPEE
jgi:hypothetical protein